VFGGCLSGDVTQIIQHPALCKQRPGSALLLGWPDRTAGSSRACPVACPRVCVHRCFGASCFIKPCRGRGSVSMFFVLFILLNGNALIQTYIAGWIQILLVGVTEVRGRSHPPAGSRGRVPLPPKKTEYFHTLQSVFLSVLHMNILHAKSQLTCCTYKRHLEDASLHLPPLPPPPRDSHLRF